MQIDKKEIEFDKSPSKSGPSFYTSNIAENLLQLSKLQSCNMPFTFLFVCMVDLFVVIEELESIIYLLFQKITRLES